MSDEKELTIKIENGEEKAVDSATDAAADMVETVIDSAEKIAEKIAYTGPSEAEIGEIVGREIARHLEGMYDRLNALESNIINANIITAQNVEANITEEIDDSEEALEEAVESDDIAEVVEEEVETIIEDFEPQSRDRKKKYFI